MQIKNTGGNSAPVMSQLNTAPLQKEEAVKSSSATISTPTLAMRPSAAAFFQMNKTNGSMGITAPKHKYKPKPLVDLNTLTQHPSITIIDNKEISIFIEWCAFAESKPTDILALLAILPEYKSIKKLAIKVHAPWPHTEPKEWHNSRLSCTKKLFAIIDTFELYKLKVTMSIDGCNFPQMKLAAAIHGLKFKKWQLYYQVYDEATKSEGDPIKIFRGSEYDSRLRGVWKKEFLTQA
ncbi:uncharacterized protein EAF01_003998 [Botrytis porri]|uniref:Uncharacterized protein n=1 Tax=Botrytis porri TaxID=87229 RepID=A0A4Z1KH05_9HELO|nr:uncharacterized protein EAF01_003998 [Botrytis porri]KAF7908243.1 hypothetical protein EAF01_003998 [Botrytis porri]TGO85373.1 hypothetical protein BPOR_0403g00090 [Botrytis porri]